MHLGYILYIPEPMLSVIYRASALMHGFEGCAIRTYLGRKDKSSSIVSPEKVDEYVRCLCGLVLVKEMACFREDL